MTATIILAKILGLYLVIVGAALLINQKYYKTALTNTVKNEGSLLIIGVFTLIFGLLLVVFHNIWVFNWPVIITLIAWATLIKGAVRLLYPKIAGKSVKILNNKPVYFAILILLIIIGLFLIYKGFYPHT